MTQRFIDLKALCASKSSSDWADVGRLALVPILIWFFLPEVKVVLLLFESFALFDGLPKARAVITTTIIS